MPACASSDKKINTTMYYRILIRITSQSSKSKGIKKHKNYCKFIQLKKFLYFFTTEFCGYEINLSVAKKSR